MAMPDCLERIKMTKQLLEHLGIELKSESGQYLMDCPACGKPLHCHISPDTGLWHCKVCGGSGNPYQLVSHYKPDMPPKDIITLLSEFGLNTDGTGARTPAELKSKPKSLSWLKDKLHKGTADELGRLCTAKGLSLDALKRFDPFVSNNEPIAYLPGFTPEQKKAVSFLRCHLDGEMVPTKDGPQKYPMLGTWGLLGLSAIKDAKVVLFCEGWRDALAATAAGYAATASTGGTGFKNEWLPAFKGKTVYIVPDADQPGIKAAQQRAVALHGTAKEVRIVTLPYKITETKGLDLYDFLTGIEEKEYYD